MTNLKWVLVVAAVVAVVLVAIILLVVLPKPAPLPPLPPPPVVAVHPKNISWIDLYPNRTLALDEEEYSNGSGYIASAHDIQYSDEKHITAFTPEGMYRGSIFTIEHLDPTNRSRLVMEINPAPDPTDGIIEGYMTFKFDLENEILIANIFLDEDWHKNITRPTNIFWGAALQNTKPYAWDEVSPGIYMDTVVDNDTYRFLKSTTGFVPDANFIVADVEQEDITSGRVNEMNFTAIAFR